MKTRYRIIGYMRHVSEWGEEGEGDPLHDTDCDWLNCEADTLEELDDHLETYGLPPLREWNHYDAWAGDGPPRYETNLNENGESLPDPDGKFIVDYCIKVEVLQVEPYIMEGQASDL